MLAFSNVCASYGKIEVLHGVNLDVSPGCAFLLLGDNGAGKSTLLKVASGRLAASSGQIEIDSVPISKTAPEDLAQRGVCAIPEGRGVFPNLTVTENLRIWTYQRGVTRGEVEHTTFSRFPRLKERRDHYAGQLSGGEQQMLAISRALVGSPRLLLLDEISMGLAPIVVAELYELVAQIVADGVTVIIVEQFATTALRVANRAAVISRGVIEAHGTPEEMSQLLRATWR